MITRLLLTVTLKVELLRRLDGVMQVVPLLLREVKLGSVDVALGSQQYVGL